MATQQLTGAPKRADHPTARLGRLHVEHDRGIGMGLSRWPLGEVRIGETVTTTAEITSIKTFPGFVHMILDDGHGGSALVTAISSAVISAFRAAGLPPKIGVRVQIHGTAVQPPIAAAPRGIEADTIRVVA